MALPDDRTAAGEAGGPMTPNQGACTFIPIGRRYGVRLQYDHRIWLVGVAFRFDQPIPGVAHGGKYDAVGFHFLWFAAIVYRAI